MTGRERRATAARRTPRGVIIVAEGALVDERADRRGFDPHDDDPPAAAHLDAAEVVRAVVEPEAAGVLRRRRPNRPPVVTVRDRYLVGRLDLRGVEFPYLLEFERCRFEFAPDLRQAKLAGIEFVDCALPGLLARNVHSDNDVQLVDGTTVHGTADLTDGEIHGSLVLRDCTLVNLDGPALHADRLQLVGALMAARLRLRGEARIAGLRAGGNVNLSGAELDNPRGFALNGNGLHVGGNLLLTVDPVSGEPFRSTGLLYLPSARVDSDFSLRGARLAPRERHPADQVEEDLSFDPDAALIADRSKVDGDLVLDRGFTSTGTVRAVNAYIGGSLRLVECRVDMSGGREGFAERFGGAPLPGPYPSRALHFDGTEIRGGLDARAARIAGQVRVVDVAVQGSVRLDEAIISNRGGDAFEGRRFGVGGNLDARSLLVFGSVLLPGARIGSNLDLRGSRLVNPGVFARDGSQKPVLDLRVSQIGRDLVCAAGERPFSAGGEIRIRRAEISRETNFSGAELGGGRGSVALNAFGVRTQELRLDVATPPRGRVDLRHVRCASLDDGRHLWSATGRVEMEDFGYDALAHPVELDDHEQIRTRLRWLWQGMREIYRPGPYDQFAAVLRASGNEEHAAVVLVEKQRRRYEALADGARLAAPGIRLWSWLQRWMVGYGYRPTRALAWLVGFLVAGTVWFSVLPTPNEANSDDTLVWNPVLYTLDLLVPIVDFGHKNKWTIPGASQWIAALFVALGWVLATTVAAGVTRMLRRTT